MAADLPETDKTISLFSTNCKKFSVSAGTNGNPEIPLRFYNDVKVVLRENSPEVSP